MGPLRLSFDCLFGPIVCWGIALAIVESWTTFPWFLSGPDQVDTYGSAAKWLWLTAPLQGAAVGVAIGNWSNRHRGLGAIVGIAVAVYIDAILRFVAFFLQHVAVIITSNPGL